MQESRSRKADKRHGTRHQRTRANLRQVLKHRKPADLWTSGHDERQTAGHISACFPSCISKICLDFALCCLRKSRENTKAHQKFIHFCPVLPWFDALLTLWVPEDSGSRSEWKPVWHIESIQKGTPPLFEERQEPFTPIIFRTENTEKGQPQRTGWCRKFFGNFFGGMFRGKRKAPNLEERGRGAKIRKIGLRVQR